MANKLYSETAIQNIASSIRGKNGTQNSYTVSQMPQAILDLPTGGQSYNNGKNNFWVYISEANTSVTVTVETSGDTVDWGDGTVDTNTTHTYTNAGVYIISADSLKDISNGNVIYIELNNAVTLPVYTSNTSLMKVKLNNSSFTTIQDSMFDNCLLLQIADVPYITSINYNAFKNCRSLTTVNLPNTVTSIGTSAFYNCISLTSVNLPNTVTSIGNSAFSGCSSLQDITIPNTLTSISDKVFSGCMSLTSVTIPNGVTTIGGGAFYNCSSLTNITMPNSVTNIGQTAFYSCGNLTSFDFTNITSIGNGAFSGTFSGGAGLLSVTLPSTITTIGANVFRYNYNLTTVNINCDIPTTVNQVFANCTSLQTVTVGANVTALGNNIFSSTNSTYVIHLQGTTPPALDSALLGQSPAAIYVPASAVETYQNDSAWSTYASVIQAEPTAGE